MTTHSDIREWLERGKKDKRKPTHMLVVCDTFDHEDYPVYVYPDEDVYKRSEGYRNGENMQRLMEVYKYSMDLETQLNQHRSFNY
jgi:hypothetical protein